MYGKETNLTVSRIFRIYNAVNTIQNIDWLPGTTAYGISRLCEAAESIMKVANKRKEDLRKSYLVKFKAAENNEEEKVKINEWYTAEKELLLDIEETIGVPDFKLEDFMCKQDFKTPIKITTKEGKDAYETKEFRKGQILVPQLFLNLMGDIIKEK